MAEKHLRSAGADSVVCPYVFAGQRIAHSFLRPHVVSFLDTATTHLGMDLEIGEVPITPRSPFAGKTIENSRIRQDRGVIILAIKREAGMRFNPAPDDRIEAGDFLIAMGEPQQLRELEQTAGSNHPGRNHEDRERGGNARDRSRHLGALRSAFPHLDGERRLGRRPFRPLRLPASGARRHSLRQRQQRRRWIRRRPQARRSGPRRARSAVVRIPKSFAAMRRPCFRAW